MRISDWSSDVCSSDLLGLSGAVLQGYLRNPLADPAVVGVSSSAALGAVAAIVFGWAGGVFACAMLAAAGSMALLAALTWRTQSAVGFILAGTVLASLSGALTPFLISIAPTPYAPAEATDWLKVGRASCRDSVCQYG